jgi:hypothetical protein
MSRNCETHTCLCNIILPQLRNDLSMEDLSIYTKVYVSQHVQCIEDNINTLQQTMHVLNELHNKFCTNIHPHGSRSLPDNEDKNEDSNSVPDNDVQEEGEDDENVHSTKKRGRPAANHKGGSSAKKRNNK